MAADQAEGLRRWAQSRRVESSVATASTNTLIVVGLSEKPGNKGPALVTHLLSHWAGEGRRWIGDPAAWRVVALDAASPYVPVLVNEQPRWGLWVDNDRQGFRRAFHQLQELHRSRGPNRLLALHSPELSRRGLLSNVQQAAAEYFGIELLVLAR